MTTNILFDNNSKVIHLPVDDLKDKTEISLPTTTPPPTNWLLLNSFSTLSTNNKNENMYIEYLKIKLYLIAEQKGLLYNESNMNNIKSFMTETCTSLENNIIEEFTKLIENFYQPSMTGLHYIYIKELNEIKPPPTILTSTNILLLHDTDGTIILEQRQQQSNYKLSFIVFSI